MKIKYIIIAFILAPNVKVYSQQIMEKKDTFSMILSLELCKAQYSFCSDGHEQPLRSLPYLVQLDTTDFSNSYSKDVFSLSNCIDPSQICPMDSGELFLDRLLNSTTENNTKSFFYKGYAKRISLFYHENKINQKFDGRFYYAQFKMVFTTGFVKETEISVPFLQSTKKDWLTKKVITKVYHIDHIISFSPL